MSLPTCEWRIGDAATVVAGMDDHSVGAVVTSPPYWGLRRYTDDPRELGGGGMDEYLTDLSVVTGDLRRVVRTDGVLWLNIADTAVGSGGSRLSGRGPLDPPAVRPRGRAGLQSPQWAAIPARVALQTQAQGWMLRSWVVWDRQRRRPERLASARRPGVQWETVLLFANSSSYLFDADSLVDDGDVWSVPATPGRHDHPAAFPTELVRRCLSPLQAFSPVVLDPFAGSGTTCVVAARMGCDSVGIDLDPRQAAVAARRLDGVAAFTSR